MISAKDFSQEQLDFLRSLFGDKLSTPAPAGFIQKETFNVAVANTGTLLNYHGDFVRSDLSSRGVINIQFNGPGSSVYPLYPGESVEGVPYRSLLVSWAAQASIADGSGNVNLWWGANAKFSGQSKYVWLGPSYPTHQVREFSFNQPGTSFVSTAALLANTPENVIAAASNTTGLRILHAGWQQTAAASSACSLLAKSTAPVSFADGAVLLGNMSQTAFVNFAHLTQIIRNVNPGLRLDFVSELATTGNFRHINYLFQ